jgi:GT2 family glycosyltransferase/glycosyltransferase involved in cell wall biosynthesis
VSSGTDLNIPVRVVFASGTAELNRTMLRHFERERPDLPLVVVAEFEPDTGEWIPWHVHRTFDQNLTLVNAALAGRRIESAAMAFDRRSASGDLRKAARAMAPKVLTAYDEEMATAGPAELRGFLLRRGLRALRGQLREGSRARLWLRRIAHPSEAEIPIRARIAQTRGAAAVHMRGTRREIPALPGKALTDGVSVVIPSRDGMELLRTMLPLLLAQITDGEVIVVDNGSTDGTAEWLAHEHPRIRVVRHSAPLSFARSVNMGIQEASHSRTLLLNNDMIVEPGFIEVLNTAFCRVPDLFCSTAQILFPPGLRREETGKAVWRSGAPEDFPLRCDEPASGEDLTWVLYGSGGCSLYDTAKLRELGGISELYEPAYVEDLDAGFRAWKRGWASVYCADARVEHRHRSTTSRFYTARQIEFFTERNYLRFVSNAVSDGTLFSRLWKMAIRRLQLVAMHGTGSALDALRGVPKVGPAPPNPTGHLTEEDVLGLTNGDIAVFPGLRKSSRKTILIASPYLPFPLSHGGAVRIYNLMKLAADQNDLILVAFADALSSPPAELLELCSQIVLVRRHGTHYRRDTVRPDVVEEFDSPSFRACLKQAVHQWRPTVVQLEFTWMAQYAETCRPAKTILIEHDITFDLQQQLVATSPSTGPAALELRQQLAKWQSFETDAWRQVDCVVTMSAKDLKTVTGARQVECLPNGVDCERFQPSDIEPEPQRLLLIGSFAHLPNLLALDFFVRDVWPLLPPGYKLHVIGGARHDYYLDFFRDRIFADFTQSGIEVEGFVSDVRGAYHRAAIVLAPLTASAGTNIKVLEAMAMGKLVVSTSAGVNGLDVTPGHDVLLAEGGPQMALEIEEILNDTARRRTIERNARATALRCDWRVVAQHQQVLYDSPGNDPLRTG